MANNKLQLNKDKTQVMVLTKKPSRRLDVRIPAVPHSSKIKILVVEIEHNLSWKYFLLEGPQSITKQMMTRLNTLKIFKKSATVNQMKIFANGILMSKLEYGAEVWTAAPDYMLKKLQSIQLEAVCTVLGPQTKYWSTTHLLKNMDWLSVRQLASLASAKLSHKIIHTSQPAVLAFRMLSRISHARISRRNGPFQLGPKPPEIGLSNISKYQYRSRIYEQIPLILKQIQKPTIFKKRLKEIS